MFGAPKAMHGPPVTVHVTSPIRRVFSERISVLTTVPLMSSAAAGAAANIHATNVIEATATVARALIDASRECRSWSGARIIVPPPRWSKLGDRRGRERFAQSVRRRGEPGVDPLRIRV